MMSALLLTDRLTHYALRRPPDQVDHQFITFRDANAKYRGQNNYGRFLYSKRNVNRMSLLRPAAAAHCVATFPTIIFLTVVC